MPQHNETNDWWMSMSLSSTDARKVCVITSHVRHSLHSFSSEFLCGFVLSTQRCVVFSLHPSLRQQKIMFSFHNFFMPFVDWKVRGWKRHSGSVCRASHNFLSDYGLEWSSLRQMLENNFLLLLAYSNVTQKHNL